MKVSIFGENIVYGVDYSNRLDCDNVIEITDQDFAEIKAGTKKINTETLELELIELPVEEEEIALDADEEIDESEEQDEE